MYRRVLFKKNVWVKEVISCDSHDVKQWFFHKSQKWWFFNAKYISNWKPMVLEVFLKLFLQNSKNLPKKNIDVKGISIIEVRQFDVGAHHQPIQQLHLCIVTIVWNSQSDIMRIEYWSWEMVFKMKLPLIHSVFAWKLTHETMCLTWCPCQQTQKCHVISFAKPVFNVRSFLPIQIYKITIQ